MLAAAGGCSRRPTPVIVLPGITGTSLVDEYPTDPRPLWTLVIGEYLVQHQREGADPRVRKVATLGSA